MKEYVYAYAVGDPFQFGYKIGQVAADDFVKAGKTPEPKSIVFSIASSSTSAYSVASASRKR